MTTYTAEEWRRMNETGQIKVGKKGRLQEVPLPEDYKAVLEKSKQPMLNKRVRNAQKVYDKDGKVLADSKLEYRLKSYLETLKIPFEFQRVFILCPKTKCKLTDKTIRPLTWKIDFVFNDRKLAIDAKGFVTEIAKIKYKVFKLTYPDWDIVFVKNINELKQYL